MKYTPADVHSFFQAHRTIRKYKNVEMPAEHLEAILYAARRAPTDATAQLYSLILLKDPKLKARIAELTQNAHIAAASASFIVCGDLHRLAEVLRVTGHEIANLPRVGVHFAIGDAVMAGQNMLIAAEMLGYQTCWIGGVMNNLEAIAEAVNLPAGVFPFAAFTIGVPDETPAERPRVPQNLSVHIDSYKQADPDEIKRAIQIMDPIHPRGDWAGLMNAYFGEGGSMENRETDLQAFLEERIYPFE